MAKNVTIESVDDETNFAQAIYSDTSSGIEFRVSMALPEDFASESDLLDYLASQWPHEIFAQRGKAAADRHTRVKGIVGTRQNITGRVRNR